MPSVERKLGGRAATWPEQTETAVVVLMLVVVGKKYKHLLMVVGGWMDGGGRINKTRQFISDTGSR